MKILKKVLLLGIVLFFLTPYIVTAEEDGKDKLKEITDEDIWYMMNNRLTELKELDSYNYGSRKVEDFSFPIYKKYGLLVTAKSAVNNIDTADFLGKDVYGNQVERYNKPTQYTGDKDGPYNKLTYITSEEAGEEPNGKPWSEYLDLYANYGKGFTEKEMLDGYSFYLDPDYFSEWNLDDFYKSDKKYHGGTEPDIDYSIKTKILQKSIITSPLTLGSHLKN